ncbi:Alpha/Beta hydrolase protein [Cadophora sp. MPI-SDFR-AT-0126]|nr:Alpha/Beta hydrolase protein [Leotiomycetes sp. MPI-SDFR-AT-0126]
MSAKPTLVLVHGAFHGPYCFHLIQPKLEALGYPVIAVALVSARRSHPTATHLDDVAAIHEVMIPVLDGGKEVILITHSYGGIPGVASIEGHTIQDRAARGEKGGIKSIFMISCRIILEKGASLSQSNSSNSIGWVDMDEFFGICNSLAKEVFYNDLSFVEADHYFSLLQPFALTAFSGPVNYVASDLKIPKGYLICEKDMAIPLAHQEKIVDVVGGFKTFRCDSGHSPFLSQPDATVRIIDKFASEK